MTSIGADLVRQMAAGDREAFGVFYDRYAPVVFPLILRIVRERADASMVTRARTRAIDRIRSTRRRSETFVAPLDEGLAAGPRESAPDAAERAADRGTVMSALDRLPDAQREVIELAYYAGLTQTEIAERLKQPLGTVKTRIRLALERLREVVKTSS